MTQMLRMHAAHAEDWRLDPSIRTGRFVAACNSGSSGSDPSGLQGHRTHMHMPTWVHAYTHAKLGIKVVKTASHERSSTIHLLHPQHCCKL